MKYPKTSDEALQKGMAELATTALSQHEAPFFVYSSRMIEANIKALRSAFDGACDIFYSFKANPNMSICSFMKTQGVCAEVCSLPEVKLAEEIGFDPQDIIFVGPAKEERILSFLIERQIYAIVVENALELQQIAHISKALGKRTRVALRINPDFSNPKAPLKMGGVASQFGMDMRELEKARVYLDDPHLEAIGFHIYNGTRILDADSIASNCERVFALAESLSRTLNVALEMVDVGGGYGIPYFQGEDALDMEALKAALREPLRRFREKFPKTRLITESGRYLVGNAGCLVSKVLYVKESYGKKFAITNAGMNCHMAACGVGSFLRRNFPVARLGGADALSERYTITGPLCTPSDIMAQDAELPQLKPGDHIQILMSGAYGPSASPGYFLSHGFPKELLVHEGHVHVVRESDEYSDIFGKHKNIFQDPKAKEGSK